MIEHSSAHIDEVVDEAQVTPIYPRTLTETVQHIGLTDNETWAVLAADALSITFPQKQTLAATHIFLTEPTAALRARDVLGVSIDQVVEARDNVITNPDYTTLWSQHQALVADPVLAAVAIYKKSRFNRIKIAEKMGLDEKTVAKLFIKLVDLGVTEDKRKHSLAFSKFCEEVRDADSRGEPLPTEDLARELKTKPFRIRRARIRNRDRGKPAAPGKEIFAPQALEIRGAILAHPELGDIAIANLLGKGYTARQIGWQRTNLYNEALAQRWRATPGFSNAGDKSTPRRIEAKNTLAAILAEIKQMGVDEDVVLTDLRRDGHPSLRKVGMTTLYTVYKEIASEHSVPPLRFARPH